MPAARTEGALRLWGGTLVGPPRANLGAYPVVAGARNTGHDREQLVLVSRGRL